MNPVIRGNFILNNDQDGIRLAGGSCVVIEDNYVNRNGGSGILVTDRDTCVIRNNTANANDVYGIGVSNGVSNGAQVTGNRALRNGTDLFWNGIGTGCWAENVFKTSQPAVLPACP